MSYTLSTLATNDPRKLMFADDLPFWIGRNILENKQVNQLPIWNATGSFADADISRAGYPAYLACDLAGEFPTMADPALDTHESHLADATDLYLLFDQLPTYAKESNSPNVADTLLVWIANLNDLITHGVTFQWEIANDNVFSPGPPGTALQPIANWTSIPGHGAWYTRNITTNGRAFCYDLNDAAGTGQAQVSNVEFMRLHFQAPIGTFVAHTPVVTEVWFGPRVCITRPPTIGTRVPRHMRDFDPSIGKYEDQLTGQRMDIAFAESRTAPSPGWDPFGPGLQKEYGGTTDNGLQLLTQYRHHRHGMQPFVYVPNPKTAGDLAYLYKMDDPKFGLQRADGNAAWALPAKKWVEQPPFVEDETQGLYAGEEP